MEQNTNALLEDIAQRGSSGGFPAASMLHLFMSEAAGHHCHKHSHCQRGGTLSSVHGTGSISPRTVTAMLPEWRV